MSKKTKSSKAKLFLKLMKKKMEKEKKKMILKE